jgi:hypothetical protein
MTKLQAEAVARKFKSAIGIHYQNQVERLRKHQAEAMTYVQDWLDSGAYRKKGHDAPIVPSFRLQPDNAFNILRSLGGPECVCGNQGRCTYCTGYSR